MLTIYRGEGGHGGGGPSSNGSANPVPGRGSGLCWTAFTAPTILTTAGAAGPAVPAAADR